MKKIVAVSIIAVVALAAAVGFRSAQGASNLEVDAKELSAQLAQFVGPDGRITQPLVRPPDALDATAWGRLLMHAALPEPLPVPNRAKVERLRAESPASGALWADFYAMAALTASNAPPTVPLEVSDRVMKRLAPDGSFGEQDDPARAKDPAHRVLATWAAVRTLGAPAGKSLKSTVPWVTTGLRTCAGNDFTRWHLYDTLVKLNPAGASPARAMLLRCHRPVAKERLRAPADEEELLALVGDALVTQFQPAESSGEHRAALRAALAPKVPQSLDTWWSWNAFTGYVAAGGQAREYEPVAQRIRTQLSDDGLLPQFTVASSPLETVYQAVQITTGAGLPVQTVIAPDVLKALPKSEGTGWQDSDYAMWASTMHQAGIQLSADQQADAIRRATVCSSGAVTPASFRAVALCARTLQRLGQPVPVRVVASGAWRGAPHEAVVQLAASVEASWLPSDLRDRVPEAIRSVLANRSQSPTTVLADLPAAATAVGSELEKSDRRSLVTEIDRRRGSGDIDQLFRMDHSTTQVDFAATAAVMNGMLR